MAIDLITTTAGALAFLESAVNWQGTFAPQDWMICLFSNNVTVDDTKDVGDFDITSAHGIAPILPTWAAVALVAGVPSRVASTVTFTSTGGWPLTYYGVVVQDGNLTHMVGAANFTAPVVLTSAQPSYSAQVTVTSQSEF